MRRSVMAKTADYSNRLVLSAADTNVNSKEELITKKQISLLGAVCIIISQCKIVYLPVCLLVFLIPKEIHRLGLWCGGALHMDSN